MTHGRLSRFLAFRLAVLVIGNLLLLGWIALRIPEGGSFGVVLSNMGVDLCALVLVALAMTGVIGSGSIDISVSSILAVGATVFGILVSHSLHPVLCFTVAFLTAWSLSMANGYLVRALRLPAIIVTLGALTFYRGVAAILASLFTNGAFLGPLYIVSGDEGEYDYSGPGFHYPGWILIGVVTVAIVWEWNARRPRTWLALGGSEEACRLQGLSPGKTLQSAFFVAGLFLGVAAIVAGSGRATIVPEKMAWGLELHAIGAVVVGGTNIFGGEGSYTGTVLGCLFFYFLRQGLIYEGISDHYTEVVLGATILGVIGFDCWLHRGAKRMEELR